VFSGLSKFDDPARRETRGVRDIEKGRSARRGKASRRITADCNNKARAFARRKTGEDRRRSKSKRFYLRARARAGKQRRRRVSVFLKARKVPRSLGNFRAS